jgi:hypothetical protein
MYARRASRFRANPPGGPAGLVAPTGKASRLGSAPVGPPESQRQRSGTIPGSLTSQLTWGMIWRSSARRRRGLTRGVLRTIVSGPTYPRRGPAGARLHGPEEASRLRLLTRPVLVQVFHGGLRTGPLTPSRLGAALPAADSLRPWVPRGTACRASGTPPPARGPITAVGPRGPPT